MILFCSKCEKPVADPEYSEAVDGYLLSCPECGGPIAELNYSEVDKSYKEIVTNLTLGMFFQTPDNCGCSGDCTYKEDFTADERRYLRHIVEKQQSKVEHAHAQLGNILEKLGDDND